MITFKKTFDFYATDGELKVFIDNIVDTLVGDLKDDVKLSVEEDDDHRYVTLKIFGRMLH